MKKIASAILAGLGAVYLGALIWELFVGHGTIMMEASKTEPMDHRSFLIILSWCLASIYAGIQLWSQED